MSTVLGVAGSMALLTYVGLMLLLPLLKAETSTLELVAGTAVAALFGALFCSYELFFVEGPPGRWIRRTHFGVRLAISFTVFVLFMTLVGGLFEALMYADAAPGTYMGIEVADRRVAFLADLSVGVVMFVALFLVFALRRVIDGPTLVNLLSGRYRQAVLGERIFLFLDLADSTAMTEKLGEVGAYALISQIFFDIDEIILDHAGKPDRYRGDEIVVTWSLHTGTEYANCIRCVFAIHALMRENADRYEELLGWRPVFRAGLHCGPVAIGECGDSRREIQYFGDTINTAARIQSRCRELGEDVLVSADLLSRLELPASLTARDLGDSHLRGRSGPIRLFGITSGATGEPVGLARGGGVEPRTMTGR